MAEKEIGFCELQVYFQLCASVLTRASAVQFHVLTPDGPPEDPAGSSEVVRPSRGVGVHPLTQESKILHWTPQKHIFLELVEHFTVTSTCNVDVSDGSACTVVSLSLKLEL